jgi:hypothetical protein
MIFALDKDNGALLALPSPLEAPMHCKAIDVKDGFWLFFDDDGSPFEARFDPAEDTELGPGPYTLERAMGGLWLQERIKKVTSVRGCGIATLADLDETLRINRGKRANLLRGGIPRP